MPSASSFSGAFYRSITAGAAKAAASIAPLVQRCIGAKSVVDFGCGTGAWLEAFRACGSKEVLGLDQFDPAGVALRIAPGEYRRVDLTLPVAVGARFDLALCLEVGEHLPPASSQTLVRNLVAAADCVVFSAAVPGQGGVGHFNERPIAEWVKMFADEGYSASDFVRAEIAERRLPAEPWYRYNTLFFYRSSLAAAQPACVREHELTDPSRIPERAAAWWRARCALVGLLPVGAATALANLKHNVRSTLGRT